MRVLITALLVTSIMCGHSYSALQEMVEEFIGSGTEWNSQIEPKLALYNPLPKFNFQPAQMAYFEINPNLKRTGRSVQKKTESKLTKEKRKIKELLHVLNEYACIETFDNTNWDNPNWVFTCS